MGCRGAGADFQNQRFRNRGVGIAERFQSASIKLSNCEYRQRGFEALESKSLSTQILSHETPCPSRIPVTTSHRTSRAVTSTPPEKSRIYVNIRHYQTIFHTSMFLPSGNDHHNRRRREKQILSVLQRSIRRQRSARPSTYDTQVWTIGYLVRGTLPRK